MKRHILFGGFVCVLSLAPMCHSQAIPTATRPGVIQIGAGFTFANPDYAQKYVKGASVYGDFDLSHNLGIEGDIHLASIVTPTDIGENSYLLGPRYAFHYRRFVPYAKVLGGIGQFQFQQGTYGNGASEHFLMVAFGGGVDVHVKPHINVRAFDFEYQDWPHFPPNGLSPYVMTIGVAYVFR